MPPPPGYLRFVDLCEALALARNTVYAEIARAKADGIDMEPHRFGNTTLYTYDQLRALRDHREGRVREGSLNGSDH